MLNVTAKELNGLIKVHYKTKVPLFIYGAFGIGKSSVVRQVTERIANEKKKEYVDWNRTTKEKKLELLKNPEKYFVLIDQRLSQYDLGDLKLPKFDGDRKEYLEWSIPLWLVFLTKEKADGILFFDEMNLATPSVLASCYQIFHDREANEQKLSDDILIMGAGNRLEDKAHTYDLPLPLRDRKSEVELVLNNDEWYEWALENNINSDIISFIKFREDYLLKINVDRENKSITPRGWERTSKLLNNVESEEDIRRVVSASIGDGISSEFVAFIRLQKKIDIDDILKNPERVRDMAGMDLKYSLLAGLSKRYKKNKRILTDLLNVCKNLEAEFGVLLLKLLKAEAPEHLKRKIIKEKVWTEDLFREYGKYLL